MFDPRLTDYAALLRVFWEGHDPTRRGHGRQRSIIYCASDAQRRAAIASRDAYQGALAASGLGAIVTEIAAAPDFQCAAEEQQQYLAKDARRQSALSGTGVRCP